MMKKQLTRRIAMLGLQELKEAIANGKVTLAKTFAAAFDVDCQNGFTPRCPGELPVTGGETIVDELNDQATLVCFRVGSKDAHCLAAVYNATKAEPQFTPINTDNYPDADLKWNTHCIMGTFGAELLPGLPSIVEYDYFVWKGIEPTMHPYGACYHDAAETLSTGVIEYLKNKGVGTVIVGGLATDYCVKLTVLQLKRAGFDVIVNLAACRGIADDTVLETLKTFEDEGVYCVNTAAELKELFV
jgi:nicotinamidase/pyrazinamidase